jgi:hypothetical protein
VEHATLRRACVLAKGHAQNIPITYSLPLFERLR